MLIPRTTGGDLGEEMLVPPTGRLPRQVSGTTKWRRATSTYATHYPDGVPFSMEQTGETPTGWHGMYVTRTTIRRTGTKEFRLSKSEFLLEYDRSSRLVGRVDANALLSDTVHSADNLLKKFIEEQNPEWAACLLQTVQDDERSVPGVLVSIDKTSTASKTPEVSGECRYTLTFEKPSIPNWGNRTRCVYVESVDVWEQFNHYLNKHKREVRVKVRDDTFSSQVEHVEMPYTNVQLRQRLNGGNVGTLTPNPGPLKADTEQEKVAMESLREGLTEREWRRYLKKGFVIVRGSSGREYQIFRDRWHTKVRDKGKIVSEVCARISGKVPATDNVIAFKAMIEADEKQFEKVGNVYKMAAA